MKKYNLFLIGCLSINFIQIIILAIMKIHFDNTIKAIMFWTLIYMSGIIVGYGLFIASHNKQLRVRGLYK